MGMSVRVLRGLVVAGQVLGVAFCALTSTAVVGVPTALAQSAGAIVVEGNQRVEAETIRSYFRVAPGQRLDAAKIDEGLKALYATGLFEDVRISQSGGRLVVRVVENRVINRVAFEGSDKVKDELLQAEVQSKPRGPLSKPVVQSDVARIVEIYRRNGRFDATVVPQIIELPNNRVDLVFTIREGDKTTVREINFVGNRAYGAYRLKEVIKTASTGLLSFMQSNDIYDPDRLEADRDLLRRFYLKHGFADVRVVGAMGEYDPGRKGFVVTFTIEEGPQYRVGTLDVVSNVPGIAATDLRSKLRIAPGDVYNAEAVEKSVEGMTIDAARRGAPFATVKPRGDRDAVNHRVNIVFAIEEGPRVYIERINIVGNSRTRDYVIRREFDISEGDAYNRALIDRAERRLKNLQYFKTVRITNEPGSAPDRIVLNVTVEEQSTGNFSIAGGYSTADGIIGEVSVSERNLLGRGLYAKVAGRFGSKTRGGEISFADPYFLDYRMLWGIDLFYRQQIAANTISYDSKSVGFSTRFGFQLREDLTLTTRYSLYRQEIELPDRFNNCRNATPPVTPSDTCYDDGEASLAVRKELAAGPVIVSSVGYTLAYNGLDNNKSPSAGLYAEIKQDFAGIGGDVNFIRTQLDARYYYEVIPDIVAMFRGQAGHIAGWGSKDLRMLDHFQMGPNLVRGFASSGIGPRDVTLGGNQDALGGTMYWGATAELIVPFYFLPKDIGIKGSVFADAGSLWDYKGPTTWSVTGESLLVADSSAVRSSAGIGIVWDSPFGPLRFDVAYPISKETYDRTQVFRFSGGTSF